MQFFYATRSAGGRSILIAFYQGRNKIKGKNGKKRKKTREFEKENRYKKFDFLTILCHFYDLGEGNFGKFPRPNPN